MSGLDLIVLDLAGTLVDDGGAVLNAFRLVLADEGLPYDEDDLQAARGGNKAAVLRRFAERALGPGPEAGAAASRAYARFDAVLSAEYRDGDLKPIAGAEEALGLLSGRGLKLATNTGFPRSVAAVILGRLGWTGAPFHAQVCGDEVVEGRPAPYMIYLAMQRTGVLSPSRVAVVGDTPLDLQAGSNAGAAAIVGVLTGTHGLETLGRTRHTHLLASVASLPALIESEFL